MEAFVTMTWFSALGYNAGIEAVHLDGKKRALQL
jgi:hypothetical protein